MSASAGGSASARDNGAVQQRTVVFTACRLRRAAALRAECPQTRATGFIHELRRPAARAAFAASPGHCTGDIQAAATCQGARRPVRCSQVFARRGLAAPRLVVQLEAAARVSGHAARAHAARALPFSGVRSQLLLACAVARDVRAPACCRSSLTSGGGREAAQRRGRAATNGPPERHRCFGVHASATPCAASRAPCRTPLRWRAAEGGQRACAATRGTGEGGEARAGPVPNHRFAPYASLSNATDCHREGRSC